MSKLIFLSISVIAFLLSGYMSAYGQAPETPAAFLTEHHVEDSPKGLRLALSSPDPAVRGAAAGLLAQEMDIKSIPFLESALVREPRLDIQLTLASSLNELGDSTGRTWLARKCKQTNAQPTARMLAANKLLEAGSDDCLDSVLDILGSKPDHESTSQGLLYLQKSKTPPANSLKELRLKLEYNLSHSRGEDRWNASKILAIIGDSASIVAMQKAIEEETDVACRHRLEDNLRSLKARLQIAGGHPIQ